MLTLLTLSIAFILLLLIIVWAHYINQHRKTLFVDNSFRDETNVSLYHEHKAEIEKDFQQGRLDQESYEYLNAELEQSLLQDIQDNINEAKNVKNQDETLSIYWPIGMSLFMLVFSVLLYNKNGAFDLIANTPQSSANQHSMQEEKQLILELKKLKEATELNPKNSDAWYRLGQALVGAGDFEGALDAFDSVMAIDGEQANLYGAKAQASYYLNKQKITTQVQQYIDKALSLDAKDPSTNILLGMDKFVNQQYQPAIDYWQMVVNEARPSVNIEALKGAIIEANNRLSLTGKEVKSTFDNDTGPQLLLNVSISDAIIEQLNKGEDKVVFIYAVPSEGGRMPLAALKVKASDLPLEVILNNARAMTPQAKLSDAKQVHLYAIISADGGVGIKPGDFKAELLNIDTDTKTRIDLVINSVVDAKE